MKAKLFALVIFFLWAVPAFAIEVVDTAWVRRYNGPGDSTDYTRFIAVDTSGNVYVTGQSWGSGTDFDYATIKYYPNGDTAWVRRYNGPTGSTDLAVTIAVDGSNNAYVTGYSYNSGTAFDYATIKYYPNGDTAWVRRYNGPGNDFDWTVAIAVDASGNVYVTGSINIDASDNDYATIKYYPNGDTAWVRRYNGVGSNDDEAEAITVDASGNIYVTGASQGSGTTYDYATIKYYPNGDTAWVRRYNGPIDSVDMAWAIAVDGSNNVYVTGRSYGSGTSYDYATIKYYPNGDTAWVRRYNGTGNGNDAAYDLAVDDSANVYVTGFSYGSATDSDFVTIKYYPNGDTAWLRRYNGPGNSSDWARAIAVDKAGNVYVTGRSVSSGGNYDRATVKYNPTGNTVWVTKYNGPENLGAGSWDIAVDASDNVYVNGVSVVSEAVEDYDYATIKYVQYDSIPFAQAVNYYAGDAPYSVFSSDLDGDGALDLVTANASSHDVSILKNNGNGAFQIDSSYSLGGTGGDPYRVFCADLDGDGDLELAVADLWSNYVSILKNKGDGTFDLDSNYAIGSTPISVFCADLDRDSDLDLAVAMFSNNSVSILKNYGDGTFYLDGNYPVGNLPYSVFCADLDGDGDLDLAVANDSSDNVSILKNRGDGTFEPHVDYATGDGSASVFCADLDRDGDLDLAVANPYSDSVSILKNNGFGTFVLDSNYAVGDGPISVFCADLNGDGNMDLAVANQWSNNVSILKNNGDGTFARAVHYGAGVASGSVFCADLDGDGDFDLAVANVSSDSVSILKNLTQVPANQPPWAFSLISPSDQDTVFGRPTFRWQTPYDHNFGDQIRYDLYVSTDAFFTPESTTIYDSLTISRFTDTLSINTYYWKVKAYDNWSAERWSTQTWSFDVAYLTDTLWVIAFSPVDLIVTDPMGDFIRLDSNTILGATYDTTQDYNQDSDLDDIVTIPNRLAGEYVIQVVSEPNDSGDYSLGIRIDGTLEYSICTNQPSPPHGGVDTFSYNAPVCLNGDLTGDMQIALGDVVYLITFLYKNGPAPHPLELADVNSNGVVDLGDLVYLISYQYKGGPKPPCWQ